MTPEAFRLFRELGSGETVELRDHARRHGTRLENVRRWIEDIRLAGGPVEQAPGDACRLPWSIDFLDADAIRRSAGASVDAVEVHDQLDTTNRLVCERFRHRKAVLAEFQHAGRGRRGRAWRSPPGCGIWLSYGYRFHGSLARLSALSLAAGIAIVEALPTPVGLKWPNDLVVHGRKLGGVLIEARGGADSGCEVALGVGVNVRLPQVDGKAGADPPWTDLSREVSRPVDRNRLAGALIAALDAGCATFDQYGFAGFADRWRARDVLSGRDVVVRPAGESPVRGRAEGVDVHGRLRVSTGHGPRSFDSGEVSVRFG